jgi:putative FmdB family regulatory protein
MPIYEYMCNFCNSRKRPEENEEHFYLVTDKPPEPPPLCPNCGSDRVRRIWTPPTIKYKGKGFYSTDSKHGDDLNV